jgi:hypothetical protein
MKGFPADFVTIAKVPPPSAAGAASSAAASSAGAASSAAAGAESAEADVAGAAAHPAKMPVAIAAHNNTLMTFFFILNILLNNLPVNRPLFTYTLVYVYSDINDIKNPPAFKR